MKGNVSIYKGYTDGAGASVVETHVLQEDNLIVDGFKEHIVDLLTRIPAPSADYSSVSSTYDASNYGIQAFTLSPNESAFSRIHALAAASGYVASSNGAGEPQYRNLDVSDGTAWSYNKDITNHLFSAVNYPSALVPNPNSKLENPDLSFSSLTPHLTNGRFRDYSLDETLSGIYMNEQLELYDLNGWDIQSWLRFAPSALEFLDAYRAGSCSRYQMSGVAPIYSSLSGSSAYDTYSEADDGILFVRSFKSGVSTDGSGLVSLSQPFKINTSDISKSINLNTTDNILVEITAQFSAVSGGTGSTIRVLVEDETEGDAYFFSAGSSDRHSWGPTGERLVTAAVSSTSGTISQFVQIPASKLNSTFRITYQFYCHDATDVLKTYFWNANVNHVNGWYLGNIFSGSDMHRVYDNDFKDASLYLGCSSIGVSPTATPLSSTTYITQAFNLDPLKKYSVNPFFSGTQAMVSPDDALSVFVVKKSSSNVVNQGRYNYFTQKSCSSLMADTRLQSPNYCVSPEHPRESAENMYWLNQNIKPSDLCIEIPKVTYINGTVDLPKNKPATFKLKTLKSFENGVSATQPIISIRTLNLDANGVPLYFNFLTARWDVSSALTQEGVEYNLSAYSDTGWDAFESREIDVNQLIGLVAESASDGFELVVKVNNPYDKPVFAKELRMDAKAPTTHIEEVWRINDMDTIDFDGNRQWQVLDYSGQNLFSGLATGFYQDVQASASVTNLLPTFPLENMYCASGSTHSSESRYQIYIVNSKTTNPATQAYKLNLLSLVDNALITATEAPPEDIFTSESYTRTLNMDFVNQPLFQWVDTSSAYHEGDNYNRAHPGVGIINPPGYVDLFTQRYWDFSSGVITANYGSPGTDAPVDPELSFLYNFNLSDITLPLSSTEMAFSVIFNQVDVLSEGTEPEVKWQVAATTKTGDVVWWDATTSGWESKTLSAIPSNAYLPGFTFDRGTHATAKLEPKWVLSNKFDITNKDFDDTTKIQVRLKTSDYDIYDIMTVTQWQFYTINVLPPRDLGVFPAPNDTTVQPTVSPQGELGHFTNQIQLEGSLSGVDRARAGGNANYTTSGSLTVSGVVMDSFLNQYDVLNTDGYILFGYKGPLAAGFYGRGFHSAPTSTSMVYTLDLSAGDALYLDVQGGIGAIGLHTVDVNQTFKKLKDNGHSLSSLYVKPDLSTELYTVSDVTRNPIFNLVSKKVFRTPVDINPAANSFTRFQWEIKFI